MFEDRKNRTELSEVGEFSLIKHLTEHIILKNSSSIKGVGDDAAVIDYRGKMTLISTDLLIEGIHFDLAYYPLKHLGYKAAVVNFSDIAAMNALPSQITVSIAVSNRFSLEAVEEIYSGILLACEKYHVDLVGGDTTSSLQGLGMSLTVLGEADEKDIVYRDGARENDLLCVSGDLGAAYIGLLVLEREKHVFRSNPDMQPDLEGHDYILQRQLKPEARTDIVNLLKKNNIKPSAMIDISDGLASDVLHICNGSKIGCEIYEDKIPIDPTMAMVSKEFNIDPTTSAMNGGEDYELLFTVSQNDYERIKQYPDIHIIGYMTGENNGVNLISRSGASVPVTAQGWDALLKRKKQGG
jgi:thiamine-monophosphate kinase